MFRRLGKVAVAVLCVLAAAAAGLWVAARPATPDPFYDRPAPADAKPGDLIAAEPPAKDVPLGARAWRILYATTTADGAPATATAVVMAAENITGPRGVVAWAHGTTGIARGCAPTVMGKPFANVPALPELLAEGWAYVATDYVGLGTPGRHAYLVGEEAARGVLDSIRAARRLPDLSLENRAVVWGHSQGGNSALWAGMRARAYAPDLEILGVAALAPASDLPALLSASRGSMFGKLVTSYVAHAWAAAYPDVDADALMLPAARWLARDIAGRCGSDWTALVSVLQTFLLPADGIFAADPVQGALGPRARQNIPAGPFPIPVVIAQGEDDDLVLPGIQKRYVDGLCAAGQRIDYRAYAGRDHISLVSAGSPLTPDLVAWTRDRFAGRPADGC
jgi:acetyl esterase/lipase